jgi:hypothetical protein
MHCAFDEIHLQDDAGFLYIRASSKSFTIAVDPPTKPWGWYAKGESTNLRWRSLLVLKHY